MYAQLITAHILPAKLEEFATEFSRALLPAISRKHGFKCIYVMRDAMRNKITALVVWETEPDVLSREGYQGLLLPRGAHVLAGQPTTETLEVILRA